MLSAKLQNVFFTAVMLLCLSACGQTGDLYLPGSEASSNEQEKASQNETTEKTKNQAKDQSEN